MKIFGLLICLMFPVIYGEGGADPTHRSIPQGQLRGVATTTRLGRQIYTFKGIPYAKPPLGKLRFSKPEKAEGWTGIRNATTDNGVVCATRNIYVRGRFYFYGQEDCLYLNVYTPVMGGKGNTTLLLPVMVYIHGGGWISGSGNSFYYPPDYLLDTDIVLVGFNYRLGPMGFLSMEDEKLPGNWGLKDQVLALKWVQENIQHFGGDPNSVTIFGESAGGVAVHYHYMSPLSRGLFQRGIAQSGTAVVSWSLAQPGLSRSNTRKLAQLLGCPTNDTDLITECIKTKPIKEIIEMDYHFMEWAKHPMIAFKPVVEKLALPGDAFLPEEPEAAYRGGRVANLPLITGFTNGDGALGSAPIYSNTTLLREFIEDYEKKIPMALFLRGKTRDEKALARKIWQFYIRDKQVDDTNYLNFTHMWTDGWFGVGAQDAVKLHKTYSSSPIYYYYFSYRGTVSFSEAFGSDKRDYGATHGDDLIYLFPMIKDFAGIKLSDSDTKMIDIMVQLWTNFAIYGTPTHNNSTVSWRPVKSDELEYLDIGQQGLKVEKNLLRDRFTFWSNLNLPFRIHDEL